MNQVAANTSPDLGKSLEQLVKNVEHLPVLPKVGSQLFQLLQDENRDAKKIAEVISVDPSLTAQILKVANSAYYKRVAEIEKMAMALCSGSMSRHKLHPDLGVELADVSAHLLMTAMLSNRLVGLFKFTMATPAEAYAIALLHDVGHLVLALNFPQELLQALNLSITRKIPLAQAERETWGVTHTEVGAWLVLQWRLPKTFSETIVYQDRGIPKRILMPEYLAILQVADRLSHEFQQKNPFDLSKQPPPLHESVLAFLKTNRVSWEGDLVDSLAKQNYDEFYEMRAKVSMLTQAAITFEEKAPEFLVRQPKRMS